MGKIQRLVKSFLASTYWYRTQGHWGVKKVFNSLYEGEAATPTFRAIFRDAFGDDYAEEVEPTGFLGMAELRAVARSLHVAAGQTFLDLACGRGGPGLWVARETGANLLGIDISDVAVRKAAQRAADFGVTGRAHFQTGDFSATGLPSAAYDAAMSIDSLFLVPDKSGSVRETARILRPGARFVFTTWEVDLPLMIKDYRSLLQDSGFQVERYEETPDWRARQRAIYEGILAAQAALIEEMGEASAKVWIADARTELPRLPRMRRVCVVARRGDREA